MTLKMKNAALFLLMFMVLFMLAPSATYAGEGVLREVKGYEDLDKTDLSVSNVTKTLDAKALDPELDAYFVTKAPTVVTTLNDGATFSVSKMEKIAENAYRSVGNDLPITGKVKVWLINPTDPAEQIQNTVDASQLKDLDVDMPTFLKGCSVTLTEPGYYHVYFRYEALADSAQVFIHVDGENTSADSPAAPATPAKATAKPTASKVLVNGTTASFDAYNIDGSNYFKLRDLAKVVSGTEKQFQVEYNVAVKAINLVSKTPYTAVGGELAKGDGIVKNATLNTSKIYKDGTEVALTAYNINGNNYFKLRDIASTFNIGVTWNSSTNTVGIDTSLHYVAE